jgi:anti-sigma B factor antagonist
MRICRRYRIVIRLTSVQGGLGRLGEYGLEELQLSSERRGDSLVVVIRGDLDLVTGRELDDHLTRARNEHDHIVLDLSAVDFLDTSSLAVIVGHWKVMQASGGTLALAGARYQYTKSLWITGLADRLPFYDTVDKAVAAGQHQPDAAS